MKQNIIIAFTIIIFTFLGAVSAQTAIDSIPPNIKLPSGIDLKNIKPEEVTPERLKKLGATEEQIKEAMDYKKSLENAENVEKKDTISQTREKITIQQPVLEKDVEYEAKQETVDEKNEQQQPRIYGHSFFRNTNIGIYEKTLDTKAPDNYILGAGDEISLSIWGFSDYNDVFKVDKNGAINPKLVGRIYLKGLRFDDARSLLVERFGQVYDLNNSKIEITLIYSRTINVNIVGEVFHPGSYKIPAINTAFNALIAAGGPTDIGTVRNIAIKRGGKVIRILDVYKYLVNPSSDQDYFLEDNDYIVIPPRNKTVIIGGEINRPFYYELLGNENMKELISYAGELTAKAYIKNIQVKRFENNKKEIMLDVNLDSLLANNKDFVVYDGDNIFIRTLPEGIINYVEVTGGVKLPGKYEFRNGDKITDLIKKAEGLHENAFMEEAYLTRINQNDLTQTYTKLNLFSVLNDTSGKFNFKLQAKDVLQILNKQDFIDQFSVSIEGAVRRPGLFPYADGINLKQLIKLAGGLKEDAYLQRAYIIRERTEDHTQQYISFEIDSSNDLSKLESYKLQLKDKIKILRKDDFTNQYNITISGEVRKPGIYSYHPGLSLADALILAGGMYDHADNTKIEISSIVNYDNAANKAVPTQLNIYTIGVNKDLAFDNNAQKHMLNPFDHIFVRRTPEFETQNNVNIRGEVKYPGLYTLLNKQEKLSSVIERAGGVTQYAFLEGATLYRTNNEAGLVFLKLKRALNSPKSKVNYILKDGDQIIIPQVIDLISISGEIDYPNATQINAPHHNGKRALFYIRNYGGGFNKNALKRKTYVLGANGTKRNTVHCGLFKVYPRVKKGSSIFVTDKPSKKAKEKVKKEPVDWNKVIENTSIKLTGIFTLYILFKTAFPNN